MIEINGKKLCESCFSEIREGVCPCCGFSKEGYISDATALPLGTKLNNKIIIGRVMGKGGFGITYLGYDLRMERTIAVKEYYPNGVAYRSRTGADVLIADPGSAEAYENGAEKFYSEAEIVSQFNGNPNIVSVYDYFRENNTVYLIMEYLDGMTLKSYVKKHGVLSDGQALYVMNKISAALSITHSAGVLHRDISPDNIMLCKDKKVKLIDFGAARQIMAESSSNLTVVMKPGYTPIEQYTKKGKQGAWTDIYSLGVSVYYAMTKVIIDDPYERMDGDDEFDENKYGVNSSLWEILKKCTMINSSDRYSNAIELKKALATVSEPVKAEPIVINDDDVRNAYDEESSENPNLAIITDRVRTIGTTGILAEENDSSGYDPNVNVYETAKDGGKKKSKRFWATAACVAAALALSVIGIFIGVKYSGGKIPAGTDRKDEASVSKKKDNSVTPVLQDDPDASIVVILDNKYKGDSNISSCIVKNNFDKIGGDVKVTLDIETGDFCTDNEPWYNIQAINPRDGNWLAVNISVGDDAEYLDGSYRLSEGTTQFEFAISRQNIEKLENVGLAFQTHNIIVRSATLEPIERAYDLETADAPFALSVGAFRMGVSVFSDSIKYDDFSINGPAYAGVGDSSSYFSAVRALEDGEYELTVSAADALVFDDSTLLRIVTDIDCDEWRRICSEEGADELISVVSIYNGDSKIENNGTGKLYLDENGISDWGPRVVLDIFNPGKPEYSELDSIADLRSFGGKDDTITITVRVSGIGEHPRADAQNYAASWLYFDGEYHGDWAEAAAIPRSFFTWSDYKVVLEVETGDFGSNPGVYEIKAVSGNRTINIRADDHVEKDGVYELENGETKFEFLISDLEKNDIGRPPENCLVFKTRNVKIKSAHIEATWWGFINYEEASDDGSIVHIGTQYNGDWYRSDYISGDDMYNLGTDVRVTLNVATGIFGEHDDTFAIIPCDRYFKTVDVEVENAVYQDGIIYPEWGDSSISFVISREAVAELGEEGLTFRCCNALVQTAKLEPVY